jgi:hypothetical protein
MQNSLFHAQEISNGDVVTDGDAVSGSTLRKMPHEAFKVKPRHHASPRHHNSDGARSGAIVLQADLERRGVVLSIENGAILCCGDSVVINRFAHRIVEHKSALLELLTPDVAAATGDDDIARQRVKPELARRMDNDDDVIELGRLLLKLDAGEEIESL